jgi:hypothetical protein
MSLQSALIGYLTLASLGSSVTAQENVVVQTTAVATGTMALAAGFVGIIPALGLLNVAQDGTPTHSLILDRSPRVVLCCRILRVRLLSRSYFSASNYQPTSRILMSPPIRRQVVCVLTNPLFESRSQTDYQRKAPLPLGDSYRSAYCRPTQTPTTNGAKRKPAGIFPPQHGRGTP